MQLTSFWTMITDLLQKLTTEIVSVLNSMVFSYVRFDFGAADNYLTSTFPFLSDGAL